jgi:hypothetical protein
MRFPSKILLCLAAGGLLSATAAAPARADAFDDFKRKHDDLKDRWRGRQRPDDGDERPRRAPPAPSTPAEDTPAQKAEKDRLARQAEALAANRRGVAFYDKQDWANAILCFEAALANSSGDKTMRDNLQNARNAQGRANSRAVMDQIARDIRNREAQEELARNQLRIREEIRRVQEEDRKRQEAQDAKDAAARMQKSLRAFAKAQDPPPAAPAKTLDQIIDEAYPHSPPGVNQRIKKGFEAVMLHDWKLAEAWFSDALSRDPGNQAIGRMAAAVADGALQLPSPEDIRWLFPFVPGDEPARHWEPWQLPQESDTLFLFDLPPKADPGAPPPATGPLQLPEDSDAEFLFDLPAQKPKPAPGGGPRP